MYAFGEPHYLSVRLPEREAGVADLHALGLQPARLILQKDPDVTLGAFEILIPSFQNSGPG